MAFNREVANTLQRLAIKNDNGTPADMVQQISRLEAQIAELQAQVSDLTRAQSERKV